MGFRKVISFGDSSFVISLPKEWVNKNNVKKGDSVSVEDDGSLLRICPQNIKPTQIDKDITINYNGNIRDLRSRLMYAYINNFNVINIKKNDIENYTQEIRNTIGNFIGLDVVEQKNDRLIVNDILDISSISVYDLFRRMDRIVLSMAEDARLILTDKSDRTLVLNQKDEDVNKICNLILKVLKRAQNINDMRLLKLNIGDIFYYWDLVLDVEDVADQLKRIIRGKTGKLDSNIIELFDLSIEHYKSAMKSNFTKDSELAVNIMAQRKDFASRCDKIIESLSGKNYFVIEKIKLIDSFSGNISKTLLKLGIRSG